MAWKKVDTSDIGLVLAGPVLTRLDEAVKAMQAAKTPDFVHRGYHVVDDLYVVLMPSGKAKLDFAYATNLLRVLRKKGRKAHALTHR